MIRRLLLAALAAALFVSTATAAIAQTRPLAGQTITVVEPFGRDSVTDKTLRLLAPGMEKALGAKVAIAYVRSPVGTEAFQRVAKAKPDGTTLLVITDATTTGEATTAASAATAKNCRIMRPAWAPWRRAGNRFPSSPCP